MPKWFPNDDQHVVKDFKEVLTNKEGMRPKNVEVIHQKLVPLAGSR
jgi:hypothetical protein